MTDQTDQKLTEQRDQAVLPVAQNGVDSVSDRPSRSNLPIALAEMREGLPTMEIMQAIMEMTRDLSMALDPTEVLTKAGQKFVELLGLGHTTVIAFDRVSMIGTILAEYPSRGLVGSTLPLLPALIQKLTVDKKPIVINDITRIGEIDPALERLQNVGYKSAIYMPMLVQGRTIGTISAEFYDQQHTFTPAEVEMSMIIASQVGISVQTARLFEETKQRADQFQALTDFTRRITMTFIRDEIFAVLRDYIPRLIPTDLVSVALRQPRGTLLYIYLLNDNGPTITELNAEETGLTYVASSEVPMIVDDLASGSYPDYRYFAALRMRSAAFVPLQVAGRSLGTLNLLHSEKGHYTQAESGALMQVAASTAAALENSRQYRETMQRVESERMLNQLSGAIQNPGDLNDLLVSTMRQVGQVLGARRGRVRMWLASDSDMPGNAAGVIPDPVSDSVPDDENWE